MTLDRADRVAAPALAAIVDEREALLDGLAALAYIGVDIDDPPYDTSAMRLVTIDDVRRWGYCG